MLGRAKLTLDCRQACGQLPGPGFGCFYAVRKCYESRQADTLAAGYCGVMLPPIHESHGWLYAVRQ